MSDRYRTIIASLVADPPPFVATVESATAVQVERGTALADRLAGRTTGPLPAVVADVIDAAGHRRPVYRPLLVHACGAAGVEVGPWLAILSTTADVPFTAAHGPAAAALVWSALACHDDGPFRRLVAGQQPSGALLRASSADNPETHWYHELVILHALADHGLRTADPAVWAAVGRACEFHLNETEPDHATGQPWGLPAFVRGAGRGPAGRRAAARRLGPPAGRADGRRPVAAGRHAVWSGPTDAGGFHVTTTAPTDPTPTAVPADLLDLLRCPITLSRLRQDGDWLVAEVGGMAFPVRDGFPVMLPDEAKLPAGVATLEEFKRQFGTKA